MVSGEISTSVLVRQSAPSSGTARGLSKCCVRVGIIEPNRAKAEMLAYFCSNRWELEVVVLEHQGRSGIAAVQREKPELVLATLAPTDISPDGFGLHLQHAAAPAKRVFFTSHCTDYLLHTLKSLEYRGVVFEPDESLFSLGQVIERVCRGERFTSVTILRAQKALQAAPNFFPKLLSKREQEVLACIVHSLSDEEVAGQLGLSSATALAHRRNLMLKLGIHSTPKLIRYGVEKGFNLARTGENLSVHSVNGLPSHEG